jgi:hypothetical protein
MPTAGDTGGATVEAMDADYNAHIRGWCGAASVVSSWWLARRRQRMACA